MTTTNVPDEHPLAQVYELPLGIRALGTCPRPSGKTCATEVGVLVSIASATFAPGVLLWADAEAVVSL